jgi:hypothetical protein
MHVRASTRSAAACIMLACGLSQNVALLLAPQHLPSQDVMREQSLRAHQTCHFYTEKRPMKLHNCTSAWARAEAQRLCCCRL